MSYDHRTVNNGDHMLVQAVAPRCFRIRISEEADEGSALNRYGIINQLPQPDCECREEQGYTVYATQQASLRVEHSGRFALHDAQGNPLLECADEPQTGRRGFSLKLKLPQGQHIYGLGDVTRERVEKTGYRTDMWVKNVTSYVPIPFLISSGGWALFLNTTFKSTFDIGAADQDILHISGPDRALDVYLFAGDDYEMLLDAYTDVLGKPVMLPRWAYGLMYVCHEKVNAFEMMQECLNFRREGIPCDVCGLEPGWMSEHYDFSVDKKWHPERFYIPYWAPKGDQTFFGALDRQGSKLSLWLCCDYDLSFEEERLLRGRKAAQQAEQHNADDFEQDAAFTPGRLSMDKITKPDEPWFEHLKKFVDQGARCFKLDGSNQIIDHPDRKWGNGMDDDEMHNLYPIIYNKQMSRGFEDYTGLRSMIYSAGGYAGIQQYSATWAGDTGGGPKPLVHMLNHAFSGHVNTSCDMDVFVRGGIHFGFFQPWSQLCNWAYWRQPWFLTPPRKEIYRFYAKLRYRMLPYIYAAAHRAATTGYPILRPMPMAYPQMAGADDLLQQYMFGDDMLVTAFADTVSLPDGNWLDAWTHQALPGGQTIPAQWPEHTDGTLHIREGAIIPTWADRDFIGSEQPEHMFLNIYPSAQERTYTLYEDDGESLAYREGAYATTFIRMQQAGGQVHLHIAPRKGQYPGMPARRYTINVMTCPSAQRITCNGQDVAHAVAHDGWCAQVDSGFVRFDVAEQAVPLDIVIC
ncbi:MAG: TIM-barrel domain-containing protein [Christensenellales bacterium]